MISGPALLTLLAVLLILVLWLVQGVWRIGAVSTGPDIGDRPGTALVLIDLQTVFWDNGPYDDTAKDTARSAILIEVAEAKSNKIPVIALRQEWSIPSTKVIARLTMKGAAVEGSPGTELSRDFASVADHVVVKRVQDGFETGALEALLRDLNVGTLRLAGLDANHCVLKTALAARNRGFDVTVLRNGTLAAGPTDHSMQQLSARQVHLA